MAQFFWKPDPADEGLAPSDLTIVQPWVAFDEIYVTTEGNASESHSLAFNVDAGGGRQIAIFDAIGGVTVPEARDQEVWMKFVPSGAANNTFAPLRCDRDTTRNTATGYARVGLSRRDGQAEISRYVDGDATQLDADASLDQGFDVYGQRARIEDSGADARIRLKVWLWDDGQADGGEPAAWDLDVTDTSPIDAAGAVGFFVFDGTTSFDGRVVAWGYGTDGDSAPTEPVSAGTTINAETASLSTAAQAAAISSDRDIEAALATLSAASLASTIERGKTVDVALAEMTVSGHPTDIGLDKTVAAALATLSLAAQHAVVGGDTGISASTATVTATTQQATLALDVDIAAQTATLSIVGQSGGVVLSKDVEASRATLAVAEQAAGISGDAVIGAGTAALTASATAAVTSLDVTVSADVAALVVSALQGDISAGATIDASLASLSITSFQTTITYGSVRSLSGVITIRAALNGSVSVDPSHNGNITIN